MFPSCLRDNPHLNHSGESRRRESQQEEVNKMPTRNSDDKIRSFPQDFPQVESESCFQHSWNWQNSDRRQAQFSQENASNLENHYTKMSENSSGFHYNTQNIWESKEDFHGPLNPATMPCLQPNLNPCPPNNEACLVLVIPPENRFRYRYDTEMSGTHGSLQGAYTGRDKSGPMVELLNYPYEALIRVSLVTRINKNEFYPHPHSLFVKEKLYQKKAYINWDNKCLTKTGHYCDPHYVRVGNVGNGYTAQFDGMCIISSKKENFHSAVKEKLQRWYTEQKYSTSGDDTLGPDEMEDLMGKVEKVVSSVDVDFVNLCFEAFREEDGRLIPLCRPIYSEPVGNAKSAKTGKLKISRINKCSGSCKGGDEIWLLVEKINKKGLTVRFIEEINGKVVWESCVKGDDLILHHQYAIIFKTPSYGDVNITSEVEVLMRLERTTQANRPCDFSEPITFVYEPVRSKHCKGESLCRKESILAPPKPIQPKRPRMDWPPPTAFSCQKRRMEELDFENVSFEDTDGDIEKILLENESLFELDQPKFNVEEFFKFIYSEDVDMPMQKDGAAVHGSKYRFDFLKFCKLCLKLDENEVKKLTEQISNFRVSKKESTENGSGLEKDQLEDAASTLLSLRSKAMVNKRSSDGNFSTDSNKNIVGVSSATESSFQTSRPRFKADLKELGNSHASVITFRPSAGGNVEGGKEGTCLDSPFKKSIKKERGTVEDVVGVEKMESLYRVLNENGTWEKLATAWHCSSATPLARSSSNPAKYIFECVQELHGGLELATLRDALTKINDKKALEVLHEH